MKLVTAAGLLSLVLAACASAQKPETTAASSAALTSAESADGNTSANTKTAAEEWAEKKIAAEAETAKKEAPREALDPLAMGSELEESSIPTTEITPPGQVRAKSPAELNAAIGIVKSASSVEEAAQKLTQRLGKPTWTEAPKGSESAKRRVWVANGGASCHRLVLEADGSVELESASKNEWRMLTASARQNPCTGEIKRGIAK